MKILVIITLLQSFLVTALNITKCCPESQVLNTNTKECQSEEQPLIESLLRVNILSLNVNNSVSRSEQSINYTKIPLKSSNQCDNSSSVIIKSFYIVDQPNQPKVVINSYNPIITQFCLYLTSKTSNPRTPVVLGCLPCNREKPCLNYCCPAGKINVNGSCEKRELESYHWHIERDHRPVNIELDCQESLEYTTFNLTETGEMEVDEIIRGPSEYCINHRETRTTLLLCPKEDTTDLKHVFKMILMILSLLSLFVLIIIHVVIEEVRKQHFTKLKIPFYVCLFISFLAIIITNLHDFKNSFSICVFWAFVIQYFSLAIFFWLTCMSLDIWLTFSKLESPLQNPAGKERRLKSRFRSFFVFSFGSPLIISLITLILQVASDPDKAGFIHPGIGNVSCFFQQHLPQFLYFHMIILILLCINAVFYLLMVYNFTCGVWKDNNLEQNQIRNCRIFTELVFLMGINWVSESVTFFVTWLAGKHWDNPFLVFLDTINWSIGIFMFILCCSKKVNRNLLKSLIKEKVEDLDSRRTVSTQVSNREEGYELTGSNDQLIESAVKATSNLTIQAGYSSTMWGYKDHNGPSKWDEWFPISSNGSRQSPIDIEEDNCIQETSLTPLQFYYGPESSQTIENDGNSWKVTADSSLSSLRGGPLDSEYRLVQYHAHWGCNAGEGSEHKVNGELYDGELHLVHYNTKYGSMAQALDWPDGLAVMAVLLKIGRRHDEFSKLCIILNHVQRKGLQRDISALNFSPANFFPQNKSYFTYPGSLTTPPLSECVTWMVFKEPVEISKQQLNAMRNLNIANPEEDEDRILNNYRPTQPIGDRKVIFCKAEGSIQHQTA